jgi:hypothetical protein
VGAFLDIVEGDLHHQLRPHVHGVRIARDLELQEPFRLPRQRLVRQALERLAQHDEPVAARTARAQMQVAQPAGAPAVAPLRGQNDEIQRSCQLHLQPLLPPATGGVAGRQRFHHHPLVATVQCGGDEACRLVGRGAQQPRHRRGRRQLGERPEPLGLWGVDKGRAVDAQAVEEERRQRKLRPQAVDVELAAESLHRPLERLGRSVGAQCDHLAVQNQLRRRQAAHHLHDFRNGVGHLPQIAREDLDLVAGFVHLNARAVELPFDRHIAIEVREGFVDVGRGLRQHRLHGTKELDVEARQLVHLPGERGTGDRRQRPGHHDGPADGRGRHLGGLRHRLGQHGFERALPQFAEEQPDQEILLAGRGPAQQVVELAHPLGGRSAPGRRGNSPELLVDVAKLKHRRRRRVCGIGFEDGRAAYPDAPLSRLARQEGDGDLDLRGVQPPEQRRETADLGEAAAGLRDCAAGLDQFVKQHRLTLYVSSRSGTCS